MGNAATTLPPAGPSDWGLLFLRASGALLLLWVHGLPKLLGFSQELKVIEDPLHLGALPTLLLALKLRHFQKVRRCQGGSVCLLMGCPGCGIVVEPAVAQAEAVQHPLAQCAGAFHGLEHMGFHGE